MMSVGLSCLFFIMKVALRKFFSLMPPVFCLGSGIRLLMI